MRLVANVALVVIIFAFSVSYSHGRSGRRSTFSKKEECPKITVKRNTIIRTKDSIKRGARLLHKRSVGSARECYSLCCNREDCDTSIMHYSHDEPSKMCYLFYCGNPTRCSFVEHESYAVIHLRREDDKKVTSERKADEHVNEKEEDHGRKTHLAQQSTPKTDRLPEEKCPPGSPVAMCDADPCKVHTCQAHPDARCRPSYCGGCYAHFYNRKHDRVNCKVSVLKKALTSPESGSGKDSYSNVNEEEVVVSPEEGGGLPTDDTLVDGEDPYAVKEYRTWLDGKSKDKNQLGIITEAPKAIAVTNSSKVGDTGEHGEEPATVIVQEVKVVRSIPFSVPLLIAMLICVVILAAVVWKMQCNKLGNRNKKFAVDDGDYLINGMYL